MARAPSRYGLCAVAASGVPSYAIAFLAADSHSRERPGVSGADSRIRTGTVADNSPIIAAALPTELCLRVAALHAVGRLRLEVFSHDHICKSIIPSLIYARIASPVN